ncbi:MAG TPA: hypothetical protein VLE48_12710 [Terriglobales bacterium]|nr:hypothetical protein [Terriglobales bacterium]
MIHVGPEFTELLERRPLIGVGIGLFGIGLMLWMTLALASEYRTRQDTPLPVSMAAVASLREDSFVQLRDGDWHCDQRVELEHSWQERLIFGRVSRTVVPVTGSQADPVLLVRFPGEIDCPGRRAQPAVGLVRRDSHAVPYRLQDQYPGAAFVLLDVAGEPERERLYIAGGAAFTILMLWFTLHYLRKYLGQRTSH